jgi:transcriptional regulator with XRE-family HTH domain
MLSGLQIRAARAALRWTTEELAARSGITSRTVKRLEQVNGVPPSRSSSLQSIQAALEAAGIEFIGTPGDRPGIRMRLNSGEAPASSD